jgi:hypothetical protein
MWTAFGAIEAPAGDGPVPPPAGTSGATVTTSARASSSLLRTIVLNLSIVCLTVRPPNALLRAASSPTMDSIDAFGAALRIFKAPPKPC